MDRDMEKAYEQARVNLRPATLGAETPAGHNMGCDIGNQARPAGLRERINRTLREVQNTYERGGAAQRAKEIIEKHPEFAELLDLLNQF